jgi:hypothetical protein
MTLNDGRGPFAYGLCSRRGTVAPVFAALRRAPSRAQVSSGLLNLYTSSITHPLLLAAISTKGPA